MSDRIDISVIICTYNRSQILGKTVESVAAQELPPSLNWEILVVDNNSTDETRQVAESLRSRYPERIRYLFEPRQGLSNARNTGIRESRGEIVAFMDDDETADGAWLQRLTANLHTSEWAGAGGRVVPPPGFSRPHWLSSKSPFNQGPLASFDPECAEGNFSGTSFWREYGLQKGDI